MISLLKNKKSNSVIVAGWPASGSTFLYQVADKLGLKVHKTHGSRIKNNNVLTLYPFRDPRDIICSNAKRPFKELWDAGKKEEALLKALAVLKKAKYVQSFYESQKMHNVMMVRYENFFPNNQKFIIQMIADQFSIPLGDAKMEKILEETSLEKNLERASNIDAFRSFDTKTQIHGNHIANKGKTGVWKQYFTTLVVDETKKEFGEILIDLGYEDDTNWSI